MKTRDRLLDSALHRFAADGVLATTLDEVRADAQASVGAVYHHFPDKEALFDAVRERALADFQRAFAAELERHADAEEGVRAMVRFHFRWCTDHADAARLLLAGRPRRAETMNQDLFARVNGWWGLHVHYRAVRDLEFGLRYALWLGPSMELARHWLVNDIPRPGRDAIEVLADAAWNVLKEPG